MFDREGEPAFACLYNIMQARDLAGAREPLEHLILSLGFGGYSFGLVWGGGIASITGAPGIYGGNLTTVVPAYLAAGLAADDPVVKRIRRERLPVIWTDYLRETRPRSGDDRFREVVALLNGNGIASGATIPVDLDTLGCRAALAVSAASGAEPTAFEARFAETGWIVRLAAMATGQIFGSALVREVAGTLSTSERLVLAAMAEGMRPREIAEKLGKSEHTIRNQIVSAQQRLGVRTKEGAIAKALRFGLLDV
jgi:DNA-binding CsgD family transcriptional regulator